MAHFFSSWLSLGSGGGRFVTSFASSASYAFFTASALCARSFVAGSSPPHHGPWPSTHASTALAASGRTAATAAARLPDAEPEAGEAFLADESRLACQLELRPEDSGLVVALPDDVLNILEVPIWLRGSR